MQPEPQVAKSRLLFLDFDGVMVAGGSRGQQNAYWKSGAGYRHDAFGSPWHPEAVGALDFIVASVPNLEIVISASDRVMGLDYQRARFAHRCYPGNIVGITDPQYFEHRVRGSQIQAYLHALGAYYPVRDWNVPYYDEYRQKCPVASYCILDDDSDMLLGQAKHFVQCNAQIGLTLAKAERVVRILNRDKIFGV